MPILNVDALHDILKKVLFNEGESRDDAILADGILNDFGFHPVRVTEAKLEIDRLLLELPEQFQKAKGGGGSFLNACEDKHGNLWGEHVEIEALVCLGIAVGSASWILKNMAASLPGGVPYFEIHPGEKTESENGNS